MEEAANTTSTTMLPPPPEDEGQEDEAYQKSMEFIFEVVLISFVGLLGMAGNLALIFVFARLRSQVGQRVASQPLVGNGLGHLSLYDFALKLEKFSLTVGGFFG